MKHYLIKFMVNGVRSEMIVTAFCEKDAKRLISAQYANQRVSIINASEVG